MCDLFSEKKLGDKTTSFSTKSKSLKGKTEILFNILKGTRFVCKDLGLKFLWTKSTKYMPATFIKVIKAWLSNRKSCISFPQGLSEFFDISNGVPQGDSLSGFIFILCLEMLNIKFHASNISQPNIKLPFEISPLACEFFADDSNFFVDYNPKHLFSLKLLLNDFYTATGLALNIA